MLLNRKIRMIARLYGLRTRLSIFVPRRMIVSRQLPLSMHALAPTSTSFSMMTRSVWGFLRLPSAAGMKPKPS